MSKNSESQKKPKELLLFFIGLIVFLCTYLFVPESAVWFRFGGFIISAVLLIIFVILGLKK